MHQLCVWGGREGRREGRREGGREGGRGEAFKLLHIATKENLSYSSQIFAQLHIKTELHVLYVDYHHLQTCP